MRVTRARSHRSSTNVLQCDRCQSLLNKPSMSHTGLFPSDVSSPVVGLLRRPTATALRDLRVLRGQERLGSWRLVATASLRGGSLLPPRGDRQKLNTAPSLMVRAARISVGW